ncbi:PREDICTED: GA-binding protein subunit beta-1-like isoform X3 [Priapulus caudatus]|uniref:GA-binding protein subunit beta-1-like isoform X3 n=1 Tax=Priapulus caudatus TaxID=37621 RepID=A0ABM1FA39_PRICU|nr:PREDICTED: GA-binding protein subunit beta-1-like isoform X3 [Priapulus caudatus]
MSLVDLGKRLLDASRRGDTEEVRVLMTNGAPFTTDWLGTSPLHMAAQYGHLETAEVLLRAGISRDARTKVDRTPLHVAAQQGHLEIVELLLQHGADVDAKDMIKMTPLHWAVDNENVPVIRMLLKNGADITALNKFDKTPLDIASDSGAMHIREILLDNATFHETIAEPEEVTIAEPSMVEVREDTEQPLTTMVSSRLTPIPIKTEKPSPKPASKIVLSPAMVTLASRARKKNGSGDTVDQSSTSVLATLAALAEATAPLSSATSNASAADTLQWLQTHGITFVSTDSTQAQLSAALNDEAGKLALRWAKEQSESKELKNSISLNRSPGQADSERQLYTIVTDQTTDESAPLVVSVANCEDELHAKKVNSEDLTEEIVNGENSIDALRRQLEEAKRQTELFKTQLMKKEQEASEYKRKLSQLESTSGSS